jgi:hypothetical protein
VLDVAVALTAGAIVIGAGADITSKSDNIGNSYTTDTLKQTNSKAGPSWSGRRRRPFQSSPGFDRPVGEP